VRGFLTGACAVVLAAIGLRLWVSAHEWFISDDFYFLSLVRSGDFSWREVFLPTHTRVIGVYRPLGLDGYYYVNFALFGWNAFGFYVVGLLLHVATAFVTYGIGRKLGLDERLAIFAGVLVLTADPGITGTYCACVHNYLLAGLFYALCVSWAIDSIRSHEGSGRKRWTLWASLGALVLGLLSNDVCTTAPAVVFALGLQHQGLSLHREPLLRAARVALPHAIVVALFVDFRINGVPMPVRQDSWFYEIDVGPDMLSNTWGNFALIAGDALRLGAVLLALGLALGWAATRGEGVRQSVRARLGATLFPCAMWLLAAAFPFSVLAFPHPRFALVLEAPAVLALCALLDALLPLVPRPRVAAYGLLAVCALALPWGAAIARVRHPDGAVHRRNFVLLDQLMHGPRPAPEQVDIAYGAPGLADAKALERFRWETFGGAIVHAVAPEKATEVEFRDLGDPSSETCERCTTLYLHEDLGLSRAR
jgi:hypothetical protein